MDFIELAKSRCSTRNFTEQKIETEDLKRILSAAHIAPTACNRQPQRIIVVQQPENILKVQKAYRTFGSRCILIVCRDKRLELVRDSDQMTSGNLDVGIICDHMMLAARELNIGSVIVGDFNSTAIIEGFDLPNYIYPTALLMLGYPSKGFLSPERHSKTRRALSDIVMCESYQEQEPVKIMQEYKGEQNGKNEQ